ncbi:MAG: U32 family peptidase [Clostridiales bacterium]|nr:U32 family peptidase [Clostridiales bacterium]
MTRKIEILAPAGSYEGMIAAMNAGCDAVYIGGSSFGARAYANNLNEDALLKAIDEAHLRDKSLYLTVNTLVKEKERELLLPFLEKLYLQGLDAVIVQDVGVLHFIHRYFPELPIHASTQMTLTMAQGANLLKEYGVTRLVPARELSFKEIRAIRDNTDLEIETFVHGALCYCYSGQCLMSSMIGGRSGNRGRCAQPCRMAYQLYTDGKQISTEEEKYLLSPKDINTLTVLPELVEAGVDSLKIEGRMKRPEYAAAVSSMYRKYLDLYLFSGKNKYQEVISSDEFRRDLLELADIYNRGGFSEGYGRTYHGRKMMSLRRPNHSGVLVGEVTGFSHGQASIKLKEDVNAQDVLEIRHAEEKEYEFTVKNALDTGKILKTNVGRARVKIGDLVYRTKNNALLNRIASSYIDQNQKQAIRGKMLAKVGERLTLTVSYQDISLTVFHEIVQEAMKQPMTEEKLLTSVKKTGDTPYYFEEITVDMDDHIFVPVAWLNSIRRDAITLLQEKVVGQYRRDQVKYSKNKELLMDNASNDTREQKPMGKESPGFCVRVQTIEQFNKAIEFAEVTAVYANYDTIAPSCIPNMAEKARTRGKKFYLVLPHICRYSVYERLNREIVPIIEDQNIHGFLVKNFEEISLLESLLKDKAISKEMILDYNMYVYNLEAFDFWKEKGINHFTAPIELNHQELKTLDLTESDFVIYGYLPLMVTAQCLLESTTGCKRCKEGALGNFGYLIDRIGKKFYVQTNCGGCYNTIYNGEPLSLLRYSREILESQPKNLRLDFTIEQGNEIEHVISSFVETFVHGRRPDEHMELPGSTTGHFKRGIE